MQYRREIDGLRAVAVTAVLLNHAKAPMAIGGFVGVDIFFVISGFLITMIMYADIDKGQFSLARFYERRVRRILPALFAVCAVTTLAVFLFLYPQLVYRYVDSLVATLVFVANFYFYFEQDYFAPSGDVELLLHTWTLGVEEQFYFFFPVVLLLAYRAGRAATIVAVTLIASFVLSLLAGDTAATFYLLPYRAWEFGLGALAAIARYRRPDPGLGAAAVETLAVVALALMVAAIVITPEGAPAGWLLLAVVGALLVVYLGDQSRVCRVILGNPVLVYVGAISYSLYLWHQPVFAITRIRSLRELEFVDHLLPVALVFLLSHLSYRYIETPFRNRKAMSFRRVLLNLAAMLLPMAGLAWVLAQGQTLPVLVAKEPSRQYVTALIGTARGNTWRTLDNYAPNGSELRIGVAGNSHAKDLFNALNRSGFADEVDFVPLISNRLCRQPGADRIRSLFLPMARSFERVSECSSRMLFVDEHLGDLDAIILGPLWDEALLDNLPPFLDRMRDRGVPVLVAGDTAQFPDVSLAVNNLVMDGVTSIAGLNERMTEMRVDLGATNERVRQIAGESGVGFLDREALVCPGGRCELTADYGQLTVFDVYHWTLYGAAIFGARLGETPELVEFIRSLPDYQAMPE